MTRPRPPARSTTSAVMTLVMLAIGRFVSSARLHSSLPVAKFSSAAPLACTPEGAAVREAGAAARAGVLRAGSVLRAEGAARAGWAGTAQPMRMPTAAAARATRPGRRIVLPVVSRYSDGGQASISWQQTGRWASAARIVARRGGPRGWLGRADGPGGRGRPGVLSVVWATMARTYAIPGT